MAAGELRSALEKSVARECSLVLKEAEAEIEIGTRDGPRQGINATQDTKHRGRRQLRCK